MTKHPNSNDKQLSPMSGEEIVALTLLAGTCAIIYTLYNYASVHFTDQLILWCPVIYCCCIQSYAMLKANSVSYITSYSVLYVADGFHLLDTYKDIFHSYTISLNSIQKCIIFTFGVYAMHMILKHKKKVLFLAFVYLCLQSSDFKIEL